MTEDEWQRNAIPICLVVLPWYTGSLCLIGGRVTYEPSCFLGSRRKITLSIGDMWSASLVFFFFTSISGGKYDFIS